MNILPPSPNKSERELVARCLLFEGILIGSVDEIWTHQSAFRALLTFRMCIEALHKLAERKLGVYPSSIKAVVMQMPLNDLSAPFALDEIADFITTDKQARSYWDGTIVDDMFPHTCPLCKRAAAYVGYNVVECKARCENLSSRH